MSPSVALIETPLFFGSGVLIEDGYVITTARAVWPFDEVRVVFPDGTEFLNAPVLAVDQMADIAVIGPLNTENSPLPLADEDEIVIGTDVYLIGYPHDPVQFPQPILGSGSVRGVSEWDAIGMTYYHSSVRSQSAQSVSAVVSAEGDVIAISGFISHDASTNLSASASDVKERVDRLIAGEDTALLGDRHVPTLDGITKGTISLDDNWHSATYVIREPIGTTIEVEVTGENDAAFVIYDAFGQLAALADGGDIRTETGSYVTGIEGPYFLQVAQYTESSSDFQITSNRNLVPYLDIDDQTEISIGETYPGSLDFSGDLDTFTVDMTEGDVVQLTVESVSFDPEVSITSIDGNDEIVIDDDTGGGVLGFNPRLYYRAPHTGTFVIGVTDAAAGSFTFGGYLLTVAEANSEVARSLQPTPTPPRSTELTDSEIRELRGLPQPTGLIRDLQTRDELRDQIAQSIEEDLSEEDLALFRQSDVATKLLGLVPPDSSLLDSVADLRSEGIAGYFDPTKETLFIITDETYENLSFDEEFTYAHEYVHALQHAEYDLVALQEQTDDSAISSEAYDALIEGDATLTAVLWALEARPEELDALFASQSEEGDSEELSEVPDYLTRLFSFPYDEGVTFVSELYVSGGRSFAGIDDAYANPPTTTEQILHPEKYFIGEIGEVVTLPSFTEALGAGWSSEPAETRGEFDLRVWFEVLAGADSEMSGIDAAAGWNGDVMEIMEHEDGRIAVAGSISWDDGLDDNIKFLISMIITLDLSTTFTEVASETSFAVYKNETGYLSFGVGADGESTVYAAAENLEDLRKLMTVLAPGP